MCAVERQVGLPFDFVDAAQDLTARLVGDLDELISFDRIDDGTAESRRPDITINDADKRDTFLQSPSGLDEEVFILSEQDSAQFARPIQ